MVPLLQQIEKKSFCYLIANNVFTRLATQLPDRFYVYLITKMPVTGQELQCYLYFC